MKKLLLPTALLAFLNAYSQVGINTTTPQKTFHVNGSLQVVNEVNVGGNATTAGSSGTSGQILTSRGPGVAPTWQTLNTVSGSVNSAVYVQGTTQATASPCSPQPSCTPTPIDVPGVTYTITVPPGKSQTLLFTILGYASVQDGMSSQGVLSLTQDGTKISSAYISKAGIFPNMSQGTATPASYTLAGLNSMPIPVTFLKSVSIGPGTYTFKVQYTAWRGNAILNWVPSTFGGYNQDVECMLTKMQILVYNN